MRKQLICYTPKRSIRLGWISFQPDGSISFGLNDKTYISPKFKGRHFVWNAYNRVRIRYEVASDPAALEPVRNPHFTYHPDAWFHLKSDGPSRDEALFEGIADVGLTLQQDTRMPWIRATSAPLAHLSTSGTRSGTPTYEDILHISSPGENVSILIAIDFVNIDPSFNKDDMSRWYFIWHKVSIQITMLFTTPRIATLSWFHFY